MSSFVKRVKQNSSLLDWTFLHLNRITIRSLHRRSTNFFTACPFTVSTVSELSRVGTKLIQYSKSVHPRLYLYNILTGKNFLRSFQMLLVLYNFGTEYQF
jgi:hypothetical protein